MIGDLVHGRVDEAHELDLGDRAQSLRGHADGHPGNHPFRQRCVLYTVLAELLLQAGGRAEYPAVDSNILAEHDDGRVVAHLPRVRAG